MQIRLVYIARPDRGLGFAAVEAATIFGVIAAPCRLRKHLSQRLNDRCEHQRERHN
jgi:hypothetical protein